MARGRVLLVGAVVVLLGPVLLVAVVASAAAMTATGGGEALSGAGIPPVVADAYRRAAASARGFEPACEVPAWILAGVGEVETAHGTHGGGWAAADGTVSPRIVGPRLDGAAGTAVIADTDGGAVDGDDEFDRAVGPMQFIPGTWAVYGTDGTGDGRADPHNVYDAVLTAAVYLCEAGSPMATEGDWRRGILAYNRSEAYVEAVLAAAYRHRDAASTVAAGEVVLVEVPGIGLTSIVWADRVAAMVAAAAGDGVRLTGSSYRDPARQVALREQHCGSSQYAIYEMPASECSPPTARPGTSNHERGLAIDFEDCSSRSSACYRWLVAHAGRFGIWNLPSEPWHWSVDGR